jgi:hypothetical protein
MIYRERRCLIPLCVSRPAAFTRRWGVGKLISRLTGSDSAEEGAIRPALRGKRAGGQASLTVGFAAAYEKARSRRYRYDVCRPLLEKVAYCRRLDGVRRGMRNREADRTAGWLEQCRAQVGSDARGKLARDICGKRPRGCLDGTQMPGIYDVVGLQVPGGAGGRVR